MVKPRWVWRLLISTKPHALKPLVHEDLRQCSSRFPHLWLPGEGDESTIPSIFWENLSFPSPKSNPFSHNLREFAYVSRRWPNRLKKHLQPTAFPPKKSLPPKKTKGFPCFFQVHWKTVGLLRFRMAAQQGHLVHRWKGGPHPLWRPPAYPWHLAF